MESLRAQLSALQQQRTALEADINDRAARINAPGQPGMHDSLLDKEGFPRADIDVASVRVDRVAIIRATNDHKALTSRMEALLHALHEEARQAGVSSLSSGGPPAAPPTPTPAAAPTAALAAAAGAAAHQHDDKRPRLGDAAGQSVLPQQQQQQAQLRPFAVVDEVSDGSPAAAAGIQLGDQLCRFGAAAAAAAGAGVPLRSSEVLQAVAAELQAHEGRPVDAVFLRAGQQVSLQLTPQRWAGRGLLGCHLRPL